MSVALRDPPWMREADDEMDEEWFYRSIKRYCQLCMYNLSCAVQSIDVSPDGTRICVAGARKDPAKASTAKAIAAESEVLIFSLPQKLLVDCPVREGLLNKRDFSFVAGGTWQEAKTGGVRQISLLDSTRCLLLTGNEISLWQIKEGTDLMLKVKSQELSEEVKKFRHLERHILAFSDSKAWILDSKSWTISLEQNISYVIEDAVMLEDESLVFAHSDGTISRRDSQPPHAWEKSLIFQTDRSEDLLASLSARDSGLVAFCSKSKGLLVLASLDDPQGSSRAELEDETLLACESLRWTKGGSELVAVCGGERVCVFATALGGASDESRLEKRFCHDGHTSKVTDCAGHPKVPKLFFSSGVNGSLHAWLFENERD